MSNELTQPGTMLPGQTLEFSPVHVVVAGKTMTEKRLSVVNSPDGFSAIAGNALIDMKGKVGDAIRERQARSGFAGIAKAVLDGNYKPLAQAVAIRLGKNITLTSRKDYDALRWTMEYELSNLKNGGTRTKSDGTTVDTEAAKQLRIVIGMLAEVQAYVDAIVRVREEERAAKDAETAKLTDETQAG